ncbi:MAG: peptidylprolyl isomerase [Alkalilacustris sp.]
MPFLRLLPLVAVLMLAAAAPAPAQNLFAARALVDDRVVTEFDVRQRVLFLELFNTPGDLRAEALERLIDERLQVAEARRQGIRPSDDEIAEGIAEFAARFGAEADEFLDLLAEAGLAPESFRAFVEAGLAWRQVLLARYAGRLDPGAAAVARARDVSAFRGRPRVLLSELVLPATEDNIELAELIASDTTPEQFAETARLFSAADSRAQGGRLDWVGLDDLPAELRPAIEALQPGQITDPILVEGAVILFLMRQIDRSPRLAPSEIEVEFVRARVPAEAAGSELTRLRARADSCADFLRLTANLPAEAVQRETRRLPELPAALAVTIAGLDAREMAARPEAGGAAEIVMLCSRQPIAARLPEGGMTNALVDRRLEALSAGLLAELRAAAIIERR